MRPEEVHEPVEPAVRAAVARLLAADLRQHAWIRQLEAPLAVEAALEVADHARAARLLVGPMREGLRHLAGSEVLGLVVALVLLVLLADGAETRQALLRLRPLLGLDDRAAVHVRAREVGALARVIRELLVFAAEARLAQHARRLERALHADAPRTCRPTASRT